MTFPPLPFEPELNVWPNNGCAHRRYYQIAGITVQVESDIPIADNTFARKFKQFEVAELGADCVTISHRFGLPDLSNHFLGELVSDGLPWKIYHCGPAWVYVCVTATPTGTEPCQVAVFSEDHARARIYHSAYYEKCFREGDLYSLTLLPTDQIVLARVLADRQGYYLHSAGAILNGKAMLFVGHSGAGKSTIARLLGGHGEILCDDRNIVRRTSEGLQAFGSWSHGEVERVSAASASLGAIFFLCQSLENRLSPIVTAEASLKKLLAYVIRPLTFPDWWAKVFMHVAETCRQIPCYDLEFDKSGGVVDLIEGIANTW